VAEFLEQKKRFYSTACQTKKGRRVFVKILLEKSNQWRQSLKREAILTKVLSLDKKLSSKILAPKYLASDWSGDLVWLMREYTKGEPFGFTVEEVEHQIPAGLIAKMLDGILTVSGIGDKKNTTKDFLAEAHAENPEELKK